MKIRTQFIINIVVLGSILVFVSAAVILTNQWVEATHKQEEFAVQIEREAYELGYLANDYLLYRASQQANRWESKFAAFSDHLSQLEAGAPEQQALLASMRRNQQQLKAVFEDIKTQIEAAAQTPESRLDEKFMQVSWGRLEVQSQGMIFDTSQLKVLLNEEEHRLERLARLLSLMLIGILSLLLLLNYGLSVRRILQSIANLQAGTRIIGSGNLDFAIDVKREDEIGELSHAFNQMARQLKAITASRAELEREITDRKQAEMIQQLERARWQGIVEGIADEVWTCNAQGRMSLLNLEAVTAMGLDIFKDKSVEEVYQQVEILYLDGQPRPPEQAPLLCSLRGETVRGEEIMRHRHTGITRYRQFSSAPTRDANGTITGAVAVVRDITDQKAAEEGLRRYELLSKHSRDAILFMRREDGRILESNAAAIQAYGYSREEMLGLTIRDLRAPDTLRLTTEQMAQADAGGILFETVHRRKDGSTFPVEVSSQGATISGVRTLVSVVRDISERKHAEEDLRRSEEMLRAILDQMPSGVTVRDARAGTLILSNARSREIMGTLVDSADQFGQYHGFHPDGRPYQAEDWPLARSLARGEIVHAEEVTYQHNDGTRITLSINSAPVRDPHGQTVLAVAVFDDVTRRKQIETQLADALKFTEQILTSSPVGILTYRLSGECLSANTVVAEMVGGTVEQIRNQNFHELQSWKRSGLYELAEKAIATKRPVAADVHVVTTFNKEIWVSAQFVTFQSGQEELLLLTFGDITDRKKAEEALQLKNEEIKSMSQQLWQAARLATMGELAASIAHELNNPLAIISLRAEMLQAQFSPDDPQARSLQIMESEISRMSDLVANLLQFSRRSVTQISTIQVNEELANTLELVQYHLRKYSIRTVQELSPELPLIQADRQQLRQVFLNLFTNAADAMPMGGLLTIRTWSGEKPEAGITAPLHYAAAQSLGLPVSGTPQVFIEISDTGEGIPADRLERVWEPFYTTKPEGKGTGLGLAICRRIIQEHGGAIELFSAGIPGKGATIRLSLPAMKER